MFQARNTETWESDLALDGRTSRLPALVVSQAGSRADPLPLPSKCLVSRVCLTHAFTPYPGFSLDTLCSWG